MRPRVRTFVIVVLSVLAVLCGCGPQPDNASEIRVQHAVLWDLSFTAGGVGLGGASTDATLVVTDDQGVDHQWEVRLGGPVFGAYFGAGTELVEIEQRSFDLSDADSDLTVDELFSAYTGTNKAAVLGLGVNGYALSSKHDVKINAAFFAGGLEFGVAFDSLRLKLDE